VAGLGMGSGEGRSSPYPEWGLGSLPQKIFYIWR